MSIAKVPGHVVRQSSKIAKVLLADETTADGAIAGAEVLRNEMAEEFGRKHAAYTAGVGDGETVAGHSGEGVLKCAEDAVAAKIGDHGQFTRAVRQRKKRLIEVPICEICQSKYIPQQFPSDVLFEPNGPWSKSLKLYHTLPQLANNAPAEDDSDHEAP